MDLVSEISPEKTSSKKQWSRHEQICQLTCFEQSDLNQRQWAKEKGVARTTLQVWLSRKKGLDAAQEVIDFFESEVGLAFLHRLILAIHFIFTKVGNGSIHNIHEFLELAELSPFVASSYGSQQKVSTAIDKAIAQFAADEKGRLSSSMPLKRIGLMEDETFHPEICMVAMEPVSNFILAEKYVERRDQSTWNEVLEKALSGLSVEVLQVTSDEGKAIISHVKKGLGVHHSPDLFHPLQDISRGISTSTASRIRKVEKKHEKLELEISRLEKLKSSDQPSLSRGRYIDYEKKIEAAREKERAVKKELEEAEGNREKQRKARKRISQVYHPFSLETGEKQDADQVESLLEECFHRIYDSSQFLSEKCLEHVIKAHQLVDKMKETICFFFFTLEAFLKEIEVSTAIESLMRNSLIPGFYLKQVAQKEKDKKRKNQILDKSRELLSCLKEKTHRIRELDSYKFQQVIKVSQECAQIFQRSSSAVEGRNAQLALRHHSLHRLSDTKLQALTAIHNYHLKREDGTTAAERFFEEKPKDLFEHLLNNIDLPARPRKRLKKQAA